VIGHESGDSTGLYRDTRPAGELIGTYPASSFRLQITALSRLARKGSFGGWGRFANRLNLVKTLDVTMPGVGLRAIAKNFLILSTFEIRGAVSGYLGPSLPTPLRSANPWATEA
jgi:hypothetical protein